MDLGTSMFIAELIGCGLALGVCVIHAAGAMLCQWRVRRVLAKRRALRSATRSAAGGNETVHAATDRTPD